MTIEAHKATVTTATVTIKALTINGRQVTVALFQQFQEENWEGPDGHLRGMPWGWVNRCPNRTDWVCQERRMHRHVVWQLGDELRRWCATPPEELRLEPWVDSATHWLTVAVSRGFRPSEWKNGRKSVRIKILSGAVLEITPCVEVRNFFDCWSSHKDATDRMNKAPDDDYCVNSRNQTYKSLSRAYGEMKQVAEPLLGEMDVSGWQGAVEEEIKTAQERYERRQQNWKLASELPQLCIAC